MTGCVETEVKEVVFTASEYVFVVKFHHSTAINRHPLMHVVLSSRCLIITRHSLVERRARYLFYCMFVCLFGQRFLSNPRADSRQILHAGVALVGTCLLPFWGSATPWGAKRGEMTWGWSHSCIGQLPFLFFSAMPNVVQYVGHRPAHILV